MLRTVGLSFFNYTPYLFPITFLFLLICVGSLVLAARRHQRVEPLALGIAAATIAVAGKFALESNALMFGAVAILVGASLWST